MSAHGWAQRASWSSAGSSEVSLLQEQVHSLEDRLQHARQEELRQPPGPATRPCLCSALCSHVHPPST